MKKYKILVACGAGIATSTIVCDRLEQLLKNNNIHSEIIQCKISEVATRQNEADLIVSTTILPTEYKIPAFNAVAYISGFGAEALDQKILNHLKA
ncbi:PTS galactitol transporter subunit IIB [Terrilactibacillus sp. BCM23-1]|uniref:PTS galactitol transporter subunit IIB n=1 Tax=Terrilactibacillus tamarindi TaxID=2599694 RepID=A0A6N8CQ46_9BACI|nr:PTS sugar transporter subunit IIB [Terrilactibacillus tamarindi]MTT31788.1 PTS galactitol transporter subunit IIB [Terrilactibacillus tamarindi]